MFLTLTADSQTLKTTRETNNPIAYNLKIVEYHESDSTEGFEANLRFQVAAVEIFEDHRKTFEVGTDFRILRFVSRIDTIR